MVLVVAVSDLASPESSAADGATLADQQVIRPKREAGLFRLGEMHLIQFRQIESVPEDVFRPKKRALILSNTILLRYLFSLLNLENSVDPINFPIAWVAPGL